MDSLADLKARVPIVELLELAGARFPHSWAAVNDETPYFCPWCNDRDSRNPAGSAHILKNVFHCWTCNRGGSVIDAAIYHLEENGEPAEVADAVRFLQTRWPGDDELLDPWSVSRDE